MKAFLDLLAGLGKDTGVFAWLAAVHVTLIVFATYMMEPGPPTFTEDGRELPGVIPNLGAGWLAIGTVVLQSFWIIYVVIRLRNKASDEASNK